MATIDQVKKQNALAMQLAEKARYQLALGNTDDCESYAGEALDAMTVAIALFRILPVKQRIENEEMLPVMYLVATTMARWSGQPLKAQALATVGLNSGATGIVANTLRTELETAQAILDGVDPSATTRKMALVKPTAEPPSPPTQRNAMPVDKAAQRSADYESRGFTQTPMATGEYMPGIPDPRVAPATPLFSNRQRAADTYLKEAQANGLDTKAWIAYYNRLADLTGMTAVIDVSDTDIELNRVRSAALKLLKMGIANIAELDNLVKAWKSENSWRKGEISPEILVTHQSKIATAQRLENEKAADPGNEPVDVELALLLPNGEVIWQPYKMPRKTMDEKMAEGFKLRLAQKHS